MMQKPVEVNKQQSIMKNIREGMDVYDSHGDKVGTVAELYFGASSDELEAHGVGAATAPDPKLRDNTLLDDVVVAAFGGDELPEEIRQRLIHDGFIRIDAAGLFAADRYVLAEQIERAHDDHVHLNVTSEQLLKK